MSTTKAEHTQPVISKKLGGASQDTRIDAAHFHGGEERGSPSPTVAEPAEQEPLLTADELSRQDLELESRRIERQANQLAEHLRNRQKDLDHRESQLNAAVAQLETDLRNARLWLQDREAAHQQQREKLDAREKELLERLRRLATTDAALKRRLESHAEADQPLQQFHRESQQFLQEASALKEERRQDDIQRRKQLETINNRLAQTHAEMQKLQEQLTADRQQLQAEIHSQRWQLIAQQRQGLAELEAKRNALERLGGQLDQRRAALLRLREELQQTQRQTLEICLATEELWGQLSAVVPPADLSRFLAQIRARLAEQYRSANSQLHAQRKELETARTQLAQEYQKLLKQKRLCKRWLARKHTEADQQTSRLFAREQELRQQRTRFDAQALQWQNERIKYEQEIHILRQQLAQQSPESAHDY